jgi:hypothetical protein
MNTGMQSGIGRGLGSFWTNFEAGQRSSQAQGDKRRAGELHDLQMQKAQMDLEQRQREMEEVVEMQQKAKTLRGMATGSHEVLPWKADALLAGTPLKYDFKSKQVVGTEGKPVDRKTFWHEVSKNEPEYWQKSVELAQKLDVERDAMLEARNLNMEMLSKMYGERFPDKSEGEVKDLVRTMVDMGVVMDMHGGNGVGIDKALEFIRSGNIDDLMPDKEIKGLDPYNVDIDGRRVVIDKNTGQSLYQGQNPTAWREEKKGGYEAAGLGGPDPVQPAHSNTLVSMAMGSTGKEGLFAMAGIKNSALQRAVLGDAEMFLGEYGGNPIQALEAAIRKNADTIISQAPPEEQPDKAQRIKNALASLVGMFWPGSQDTQSGPGHGGGQDQASGLGIQPQQGEVRQQVQRPSEGRQVVRRGTDKRTGRPVVMYSDGTVEYEFSQQGSGGANEAIQGSSVSPSVNPVDLTRHGQKTGSQPPAQAESAQGLGWTQGNAFSEIGSGLADLGAQFTASMPERDQRILDQYRRSPGVANHPGTYQAILTALEKYYPEEVDGFVKKYGPQQ